MKFAQSLRVAGSILALVALAAIGMAEDVRTETKPVAKAKYHGRIRLKNQTGKVVNDLHLVWETTPQPTIEHIRIAKGRDKDGNGDDDRVGSDPYPSGYTNTDENKQDLGRGEGDGDVNPGEEVDVDVYYSDAKNKPKLRGYAWTIDGTTQSNLAGSDKTIPKVEDMSKDELDARKNEVKAQDAAEKKRAEEAAKAAKKEAEKKAEDEKKAKEEAEKKAKEDAKKGDKGIQKSIGGIREGRFETENGTIRVLLPDDMRAGDTITGTVIAEPKGSTAEERAKNSDELNGMVVDMGDKKVEVKGRRFNWTVPAGALAVSYLLFKEDGTPLRANMGPIELPKPGPSPDPVGSGFTMPPAGQIGKPIAIQGPFDPNKPTLVKIGGQEAVVLAESPRQAVFEMPRGLVGPQTITVSEGGKTVAEQKVSVIRLSLTTEKTTLRKGESTTIKVRVEGLMANYPGDRLEVYFDPAYAIVQNNSPDAIEFFGPGSEPFDGTSLPKPKPSVSRSIKITPRMVNADGVFVREISIRAKQAGPFSIAAFFCLEGDFDGISRPTSNKAKPPAG